MSKRRLPCRAAALGCAAAFALTACSQGAGGDSAGSSSADRAATSASDSGRAGAGGDDGGGGGGGGGGGKGQKNAGTDLSAASLQERKIERRGSLTVTNADVASARDEVLSAVDSVDGYVAGEQSRTADDGSLARTRLELVVPTADFDTTMDAVADAGSVSSREQTARDVTEQVVDVQSRVKSAEASLHRIRLLLGRAKKLGEVIRLENVLSERQADLESLEAQQQSLAARTDTATIRVTVHAPSGASRTPDESGFLAGLSSGWAALRAAVAALATAVGAALPLTLALAIPAAVVFALVRRIRHRRATPPAPAGQ